MEVSILQIRIFIAETVHWLVVDRNRTSLYLHTSKDTKEHLILALTAYNNIFKTHLEQRKLSGTANFVPVRNWQTYLSQKYKSIYLMDAAIDLWSLVPGP